MVVLWLNTDISDAVNSCVRLNKLFGKKYTVKLFRKDNRILGNVQSIGNWN